MRRYVFESYRALAASARLAAFPPALTEIQERVLKDWNEYGY